MIEFLSTTLLH